MVTLADEIREYVLAALIKPARRRRENTVTFTALDVHRGMGLHENRMPAICEALDAPKFKDHILPLLFYKRLSGVYDDEIARLAAEFGDEGKARALAREDRVEGDDSATQAQGDEALRTTAKPISRFAPLLTKQCMQLFASVWLTPMPAAIKPLRKSQSPLCSCYAHGAV
jgi:hypothetical protein